MEKVADAILYVPAVKLFFTLQQAMHIFGLFRSKSEQLHRVGFFQAPETQQFDYKLYGTAWPGLFNKIQLALFSWRSSLPMKYQLIIDTIP